MKTVHHTFLNSRVKLCAAKLRVAGKSRRLTVTRETEQEQEEQEEKAELFLQSDTSFRASLQSTCFSST